jgi:hypothetical protein
VDKSIILDVTCVSACVSMLGEYVAAQATSSCEFCNAPALAREH